MADINTIRFVPSRPLLKEITADRLNSILAEIRRNKPIGERGITVRQSGNGTYIGLSKSSTVTQPKAVIGPWSLTASKDAETQNQYLVKVTPGTLNGILASNWDAEFTCNNSSLYYAKAVIATDGLAVTGLTIEIDTTAPTIQTPQTFAVETSVKYLFGLFFEGQTYRVIGDGDIVLLPEQWLTKDKASPAAAGALPYEIFYRLQ